MKEDIKLYPSLPAVPTAPVMSDGEGNKYRLQQINSLKRQLEDEREKRASLYKKYRRVINFVDGADTALLSTSMV